MSLEMPMMAPDRLKVITVNSVGLGRSLSFSII
jgi:hypothetical protein